jgi:Uma2 family endonuclease
VTALASFVDSRKLGIVVTRAGFTLARDPDTVRASSGAFVRADRITQGALPNGFWDGAPDLAIEVLAPSDTFERAEEKVDDYLRAGTRLLWVINPLRKILMVYRSNRTPNLLGKIDQVDGEDVVPGFRLPIAEIL